MTLIPADQLATEQIQGSSSGSSSIQSTTQTPSKVLVVEPHPTLRTVLVQRLRQDGQLAAAVGSAEEAVDLCRDQSPDLLVSADNYAEIYCSNTVRSEYSPPFDAEIQLNTGSN